MIIHVLNKHEQAVGVLSKEAPFSCPFYTDKHIENIRTGVNSFEFYVPASHEMATKIEVEGNVIFPNIDGYLQMFRIKDVEEVAGDGSYFKKVSTEHTAISDLLTEVVRPTKFSGLDAYGILNDLLDGTDYEIGEIDTTEYGDYEIEKHMTSLEAVLKVSEDFQLEIQFEVKFKHGKIVKKLIHLKQKLGTVTNKLFTYSKDLIEVTRTENSESLVTALIGIGKGDTEGTALTVKDYRPEELPEGFTKEYANDFIENQVALQEYGKNGKHKFGIFVSDNAETKKELTEQTANELKARSVPYLTFSMKVVTLEKVTGYSADKVRVGDTINAKDTSMNPPLMLEARVLEISRSHSNPEDDELVLGNYKPIKIGAYDNIKKIQDALLANEEKWSNNGVQLPEVKEVVEARVEPIERDLTDVQEEVKAKEYAIIRQPNKPEGTDFVKGQLWINSEGFIYSWNGLGWEKLITVSLSDIGAVGEEIYQQGIKDLSDARDAHEAKLETLEVAKAEHEGKINSLETAKTNNDAKIAEMEGSIADKVDASFVNGKLVYKADADSVYTKEQVDSSLGDKADSVNVYSKLEVDDALDSKVSSTKFTTDMQGVVSDLSSHETRIKQTETAISSTVSNSEYNQKITEIEDTVANKAEVEDVYSKTEADFIIGKKADSSALSLIETRVSDNETDITQTNNAIKLKADSTDVYTKSEVDTSLGTKADSVAVEAIEEVVNTNSAELSVQAGKIASKVESSVYTNKVSEIEGTVANKADSADVYNKLETDTKLGNKADNVTVSAIETRLDTAETAITQTDNAISLKADADSVYTKEQVNSSLGNKADVSAVTAIEEVVNTNSAELSVQADEIASKVSSSVYTNKVLDLEGNISDKANAVDVYNKLETDNKLGKKADDSKVNAIETRLESAETSITQTDNEIALKADASSVYTKTEVNASLSNKADNSKVNTLETAINDTNAELSVQADEIASKVASSTYNTKVSEIEGNVASKADASNVYTKTEANNLLGNKADDSKVNAIETRLDTAETSINQTDEAIKLKADASSVYTKTQVNSSLSGKANTSDVSSLETSINTKLDGKADNGDITALETAISETNAELSVQASEIASKVESSTYTQKVSALDNAIGTKADSDNVYSKYESNNLLNGKASNSKVNAIETRVSSAETAINQTDDAIKLKAEASDVYTKSQSNSLLNDKADDSKVNAISSRVTETESFIELNKDSITSSVSKTEMENAVDGIEIGGRNLITKENSFANMLTHGGSNFTATEGVTVEEWDTNEATRIQTSGGSSTIKVYKNLIRADGRQVGDRYTFSVWIKNLKDYPMNINTNHGASLDIPAGESKRVSITVTRYTASGIFQSQYRSMNVNEDLDFIVWQDKAEVGTKATDWTPAPEDIEEEISETNTRIEKAETRIKQTEDAIESTVSKTTYDADIPNLKTRMNSAESSIKQTADAITSKVEQTDFTGETMISKVNQTASTFKIDAKNIDINGAVTFSAFDSSTQNRISTAESNASTAKSTASSANTKASSAETKANSAVSTASSANSTASSANTKASNAESKADSAVSTASSANTKAGRAESTASSANSTANSANSKAGDAQSRVGQVEGKINNAVTKIDGDGVTVRDGNFFLEDSMSSTKFKVTSSRNLVKDHSFELLRGTGDISDYSWVEVEDVKAFPQSSWIKRGSPKLAQQFVAVGQIGLPIFGDKAIVVREGSYVQQYIAEGIGADTTYTLSAFFKRQFDVLGGGTPQLEAWHTDPLGRRIGTYLGFETFHPVKDDYTVERHALTFKTPADFGYLDNLQIVVISGNDRYVQADGVQLVEGSSPSVYQPEDSIWEITKGNYIPNAVQRGLWAGQRYPLYRDSHDIYPDKTLYECANGWIVEWEAYIPGEGKQYRRLHHSYIPKSMGLVNSGLSMAFRVPQQQNVDAFKYLYVYNDRIKGFDGNNSGSNADAVISAVYEF